MAELLRATTIDLPDADEITEEAADVVIVLYRLAAMCGRDLHEVIDSKMAVNRGRKWKSDGTGHGYHVRTQASEQRDSI
jgi:NTP pyrophosphatase (non-canonical NTP hydrolase)